MMKKLIIGTMILAVLTSPLCGYAENSLQGQAMLPGGVEHVHTLVSREYPIGREYVPNMLATPKVKVKSGNENRIQLRQDAASALESLFDAAERDGVILYAVSGYRSYYDQRRLFQEKATRVGEKQAMRTVAPQGTSEHQLGLAMDINGDTTLKKGLDEAFADSPEGAWVAENAHLYGFIIRYPKNAVEITGYAWEPWHLRYTGADAAEKIYALGITLEEYHSIIKVDVH